MVREAPVSALAGRDGELVERLIAALATGGNADNGWLYDVAAPLALAIGTPDAVPRAHDRNSPPADLFKIRERLLEFRDAGLEKRFLIRAVRDEISRYLANLSALDDGVDARRAEYRRQITDALNEPLGLDHFRSEHPEFAGINDNELQARLQHLSTVLEPANADEAAEYWAMSERWSILAETYLSDQDLDRWDQLRFHQR